MYSYEIDLGDAIYVITSEGMYAIIVTTLN